MKRMMLLGVLLLLVCFTPLGFAQEQDQQQMPPQEQTPPQQMPEQQTPQQQTPQEQTPPSDTQQMALELSIDGKLKSVDTDAKKIVVTTADGADMEFVYNEQTQCGGAQETIEGLSTSSGSEVTVHYKEENQQNVATRIEVKAAEGTAEEKPEVTPQQPDQDTPPADMQPPNPPDTTRPPDNPEQPLPAPPQ